jgi:hypothetical protein
LLAGTVYTLDLGAVRDLAGNALVPRTTTFTTGTGVDLTAPTIVGFVPANNAIGIPTSTTVQVQFSERINPVSVTASTFGFRVSNTGVAVAGAFTVASDSLSVTFTPTAPLAVATRYTSSISGVTNLAGLVVSGSASFTTTN